MITNLQRVNTGLDLIQEIPTMFFNNIENSTAFGDHLFPEWCIEIFSATTLSDKFQTVYDKYKLYRSKQSRDKIVNAFTITNQIEQLCNNPMGFQAIQIGDLPKRIQKEIINLFKYLYNSAINFHRFTDHVEDSINEFINRFRIENCLEVCPFCGLESFMNLEGQSRIALDHWLCKDLFPMASINLNNLIPMGTKCNERPAKGSKNILIDNPETGNRIQAFYPYTNQGGVSITFNFINEPSMNGINDDDWHLVNEPTHPNELGIHKSWNSVFNITTRYKEYYRQNIIQMWENDYKRFIEESDVLDHASNISELKSNFSNWKSCFPIRSRPGSIIYRAFIDYLINQASDGYLHGLCVNFRR